MRLLLPALLLLPPAPATLARSPSCAAHPAEAGEPGGEAARSLPPAEAVGLGSLEFPNSGSPAAQDSFRQGMLLLHSFEYEDARTAFREARRLDPEFALAAWGEALTHDHPLWAEEDLEAARAALDALAPTPAERRALAPTDREKAYLDAVEILFGEGDKADRDTAYSEALGRLAERWPDDLEARALYALSILGTVEDRGFRTYMRAAAVAEEVFATNPRHPGAAHYLIHSYDDPVHAPLGLRAARVYADIAPAATHAQHMISHIYTALGRWDEVVEANRKAVAVSEERLERLGRPLHGRNKHSLLWLHYGLLQQGRTDEARATLEQMEADAAADPTATQRWHAARMRALWIVADPAVEWAPEPVDLEEVSLDGRASQHFATGLRALARGAPEAARAELESLREPAPEEATPGEREVAEALGHQLAGLLAWREGETEEALRLLGEAAGREAARALEYGPPSIVKPGHELLGEMLLELDRPEEAAAAFATALSRAPRRVESLRGRVEALRRLGRVDEAGKVRGELEEIRGEGAASGVGTPPYLVPAEPAEPVQTGR